MNWMKSHLGWILAAGVGVVAVTLWLSPRSLPLLLILLVCPLAMFFMMRGMHGHAGYQDQEHGNDHVAHHGGHEDQEAKR